MKRLIKKAEFFDSFKLDSNSKQTLKVFKNPSQFQIEDTKTMGNGAVRGIIFSNGDILIWPGTILHDQINEYTHQSIDVNQFRFTCESTGWLIDSHNVFSIQESIDLINKYKDKLSQIGDISKKFDIMSTSDVNSEDGVDGITYHIGDKVAEKMKRLVKQSVMNIEMFKSTLNQLGDKGRNILKNIEDYKFSLEQAARITTNDQMLTQKIIQKRKSLDQAAAQIYSIVFDIENIDITQAYEQQIMPNSTPPSDGGMPGVPQDNISPNNNVPQNGAPANDVPENSAPSGGGVPSGGMSSGVPTPDAESEETSENEETDDTTNDSEDTENSDNNDDTESTDDKE